MPYKDKKKRDAYIKASGRMVSVRLMKDTDADIIEWLSHQEHPTTAIKDILRAYVEKEDQ